MAPRPALSETERKLSALSIIFLAPLWPKRQDVAEAGRPLFDAIVRDAKEYSLAVVDGDFDVALGVLAAWSPLVHAFVDGARILDNPAHEKLLRVYLYYCDQVADLSAVEK